MKHTKASLCALLLAAVLALAGCGAADANETAPADLARPAAGTVVEIKEKMFVGQLNDIYLNRNDYLGKTIKYEGMFTKYTWEENNMTYYMVYRNSPGCCGADGEAGFEVAWPKGAGKGYPKENDWCEVVGTLESYEEDGQSFLRLALDSLTVLKKRGAEFVSQ
ncbi:MAG: hypothetical protein LBG83_04750 [Oscillospiraceae bacterium]|jgi:uncharacterized membrane protein YcgQ (UPF0703/DUF1980 family)|nr:hypothetical protein [Oscillospiraceae bacterium]